MTFQEAIDQLQAELDKRGKFNFGNLLDSALGVVMQNSTAIQNKLNDLMSHKGVITAKDQADIKALLDKAAKERKARQKKRIEKTVLTVSAFLGTGVLIYYIAKPKK